MEQSSKLKSSHYFRPRALELLRDYSQTRFRADVTAGITVGVVALPLAIAFAIASGVKPEAGIFTAIIAGFLISALGGSRVQIGGPTGAFIVIVYGIVMQYGLANLLICTIIAGFMLVGLGVARLGSLIRYFPRPLVSGFTSGIAVLIMLSQVKEFLGLDIAVMPAEFLHKVPAIYAALPTLDWVTLLLAILSALLIWHYPKAWAQKIPSPIVALALGTLAVTLFHLPVETIGTRFGGIPQGLPVFDPPEFTLATVSYLIPPAITIALLGAVESLLSATVADGMADDKHDPNQELIAQGVANIVTPFFGGIPATGAIARTATNVRAGATSPISGIVHALVLLLIILIAAPLATNIPLATLAAILMIVSINMGEWREFGRLHRYPREDSTVLVTTFLLTVVFDLTVAVEVGLLLAGIFFIRKITDLTHVSQEETEHEEDTADSEPSRKLRVPRGVMVYRIYGALFFGAADKLESVLHQQHLDPEVLILKMDEVITMDASALHTLQGLADKLHRRGKHLIICGPHTQPYFMMRDAGFFDELGQENVCGSLDHALKRARSLRNSTAA